MGCCFEDFRFKWSVYFERRVRGVRVKAVRELQVEALALMRQEGLSPVELARRLQLPSRLIYHWQDMKKKNKSKKSCFHPVKLQASSSGLVLHTPRGYELQGLSLSSLRQWLEQGVL